MQDLRPELDFRRKRSQRAPQDSEYKSLTEVIREWKRHLADSFKRMPRKKQERLIEKNSVVIFVGSTVTILNIIYRSLPLLLRVFGIPVAVMGAYLFAKKCVTPFVIGELKEHLNPDTPDNTDTFENEPDKQNK